MKKTIIFVLLCAILLPSLYITSNAEIFSREIGENVTWEFDSDTGVFSILGTGAMYREHEHADYYPSGFSHSFWHRFHDYVKSIHIDDGITYVCRLAVDCVNLESVTIPDSVESIYDQSFMGCNSLKEIYLGSGLKEIWVTNLFELPALTDIYYNGTSEQWAEIAIKEENPVYEGIKIHCLLDPDNPFPDVEGGKWYSRSVLRCAEKEFMVGMKDGTFCPDSILTRAEFVVILKRFNSYYNPFYAIIPDDAVYFDDVPAGLWYSKAVAWAYRNGITAGTSATTFSPDRKITLQELITLLYSRFLGNYGCVGYGYIEKYSDCDQISGWAVKAMRWGEALGLLSETADSMLCPKAEVTRAQTAVILMRLFDYIGK